MKTKLYAFVFYCCIFCSPAFLAAQVIYDCNNLQFNFATLESRCTATGTITVTASGGSGNYNYRVEGPANTPFTSSNSITGLPPGTYKIIVQDVNSLCTREISGAVITGTYQDPAFTILKTDLTCINGNDGTISVSNQLYGREPFSFTIIAPSASGVGTSNSNGQFNNLPPGDYFIQLRDSCGGIQTRQVTIYDFDWFAPNYTVTRINCDSADVLITLSDNQGRTNTPPSTIFDGFTYGYVVSPGDTLWSNTRSFRIFLGTQRSVQLVVKDRCSVVKPYTWNDTSVRPTVAANVTISNRTCDFFRATVTGQQRLTNPEYCLYNNASVLLSCNTTGVFDNIPYGSYCIEIRDNCYDTTITRCFNVIENAPAIGSISGGNYACSTFRATVSGQTNLSNPQFCLYDNNNVLISCNSTGVFNDLPYGSYCIVMQNDAACYDTTITRCITIPPVLPSVGGSVNISNRACSTFRATVNGQTNLTNPQYCLYDQNDSLIICNSTGIFDNVLYGTYCIRIANDPACYDTTINRCFVVTPNLPSVAASVTINNLTCTDFRATITGQSNLNNPEYCLYDAADVLISCNSTGVFDNIAYGSYCIRIRNDSSCYDTTIVRCFTRTPASAMTFVATAHSTCDLGIGELRPVFTNGTQPYTVNVYYPDGSPAFSAGPQSGSSFAIQLPDLPPGLTYKVIGMDGCGNIDSVEVDPVSRTLTKNATVTQKCPGGSWPNGYGEITADHILNEGSITATIIKKNTESVLLFPSLFSPAQSLFTDLSPATYVVRYNYTGSGCNRSVYDTVTVTPYVFPNLSQSAAYQCNNNSFSIGAAVQNGVAPFSYEIIGSIPAAPSLAGMQQTNPVFTIDNGTSYSLVRLRVLDACFNATLNDVSILPLANTVITSSGNCYYNNVNLSVGAVANADYSWYRKTSATDSTLVGTGPVYNIPFLLPSDTGTYVCVTSVNSGCLTRISNFLLDAACQEILGANTITLSGKLVGNGVRLQWDKTNVQQVKSFVVERADGEGRFSQIGTVQVADPTKAGRYFFSDPAAATVQHYRLQIQFVDGSIGYSNRVSFHVKNSRKPTLFPNPMVVTSTIYFNNQTPGSFSLEAYNANGQKVYQQTTNVPASGSFMLQRSAFKSAGLYVIKITDKKTGEQHSMLLKVD
jgi:hypothetical protein